MTDAALAAVSQYRAGKRREEEPTSAQWVLAATKPTLDLVAMRIAGAHRNSRQRMRSNISTETIRPKCASSANTIMSEAQLRQTTLSSAYPVKALAMGLGDGPTPGTRHPGPIAIRRWPPVTGDTTVMKIPGWTSGGYKIR
jgi:hypothetical protein